MHHRPTSNCTIYRAAWETGHNASAPCPLVDQDSDDDLGAGLMPYEPAPLCDDDQEDVATTAHRGSAPRILSRALLYRHGLGHLGSHFYMGLRTIQL